MSYEPLMCKQLSEYVYQLLRSIGRTGDSIDCRVFVVGGFVRDLLIGRPNLDVDVVVEGDGIVFAHEFAEKAGKPEGQKAKVKCHQRFGTALVTLPDGFKVDVATARTEVYDRPGALPSVERSSIIEDLRRRDFTINAMAIELNEGRFGELVDFFGGRWDLHSRSIRVLHDLSFVDDPTRTFRAIRFEQRYGFSIEPHTERLLEKAVAGDSLKRISGKRLRSEIFLILKEEDPAPAIRRMAHFDLIKYIHPRVCISDELVELFNRVKEVLAWWNSASDLRHQTSDMRQEDLKSEVSSLEAEPILLNLLVLLDQLNTAEVEDVSDRLALRKQHAEALNVSKTRLPSVFERMGEEGGGKMHDTGYRMPDSRCRIPDAGFQMPVSGVQHPGRRGIPPSEVYEMLKGLPLEVLLFAIAKCDEEAGEPGSEGARRAESLRRSILSYITRLREVKPLVNGDDLRKLGYPEGPLYTQILDRTFAAQLDGLILGKHQAIEFVKKGFPLKSVFEFGSAIGENHGAERRRRTDGSSDLGVETEED